jgi:hypothetical protein
MKIINDIIFRTNEEKREPIKEIHNLNFRCLHDTEK